MRSPYGFRMSEYPQPNLPEPQPHQAGSIQSRFGPSLTSGATHQKSYLPLEPREYHEFWKAPTVSWWRPLVILLLGALSFLITSFIAMILGMVVVNAVGEDVNFFNVDTVLQSPTMFVANLLGIALMVPLCYLIAWISGQRPRYLSSVTGRLRWRWFGICIGIALIAIMILFAIDIFSGNQSLELSVRPYSWAMFAAVVVLLPFQPAAEELMLRGLAFRALSRWIPGRLPAFAVSAVISSAVFMALHSSNDLWLNTLYFTMGLVLCWVTWRTGGIEAAIALHICNNLTGLLLAPFIDLEQLMNREAGAGSPAVLIQPVVLMLAAVAISWLAKRRGIAVHGPCEIAAGRGLETVSR